jgi:hypothetical protein
MSEIRTAMHKGETRPPDAFRAHRDAALHLMILILGFVFVTGCQSAKQPAYQPLVARLFLEVRAGESGVPLTLPVSGVTITVGAKPVIVEYDIANAELAQVELGRCLVLHLNPAATRDLYRLSVAALGRRLVLVLNDAPLGVHRIEQAIPDGTILAFVETPDANLPSLVERLRRTLADITAVEKKSH